MLRSLLLAALAASAALSFAVPTPHPDRPDRLVETRHGFSIEYSPEDKAYMEAAFQVLEPHLAGNAETPQIPSEPPENLPLSLEDMQERREAILYAIALSIGLEEPTEYQKKAYDTFLAYYEHAGYLMRQLHVARRLIAMRGLAIWRKEVLATRLNAGEVIPDFKYNAATGDVEFEISLSLDLPPSDVEHLKAIREAIKNPSVQHSFSRDDKEGTSHFSASFSLGGVEPILARSPEIEEKDQEELSSKQESTFKEDFSFVFPIIITPENSSLPQTELAEEAVEMVKDMQSFRSQPVPQYRDSVFVSVILHETAEVGLVERYIRSDDRRWICDGTANYVAWKVARDLAGETFARAVYGLDDQLARYADLQPRIRLGRWHVAENPEQAAMDPRLNKAHYAFATRAIFLLAEQQGEDAIAKLWSAIGQTPREKTTIKTASAAYRRLTGKKLSKLIKQAERAPIP